MDLSPRRSASASLPFPGRSAARPRPPRPDNSCARGCHGFERFRHFVLRHNVEALLEGLDNAALAADPDRAIDLQDQIAFLAFIIRREDPEAIDARMDALRRGVAEAKRKAEAAGAALMSDFQPVAKALAALHALTEPCTHPLKAKLVQAPRFTRPATLLSELAEMDCASLEGCRRNAVLILNRLDRDVARFMELARSGCLPGDTQRRTQAVQIAAGQVRAFRAELGKLVESPHRKRIAGTARQFLAAVDAYEAKLKAGFADPYDRSIGKLRAWKDIDADLLWSAVAPHLPTEAARESCGA